MGHRRISYNSSSNKTQHSHLMRAFRKVGNPAYLIYSDRYFEFIAYAYGGGVSKKKLSPAQLSERNQIYMQAQAKYIATGTLKAYANRGRP